MNRDIALEKARSDFDRAVAKAASAAQGRRRTALRQWEAAKEQAHQVAAIRVGVWRQHDGLETEELLARLTVHEFRLSPAYAAQRLSSQSARVELWYVRMIRSILIRRSTPDEEAS